MWWKINRDQLRGAVNSLPKPTAWALLLSERLLGQPNHGEGCKGGEETGSSLELPIKPPWTPSTPQSGVTGELQLLHFFFCNLRSFCLFGNFSPPGMQERSRKHVESPKFDEERKRLTLSVAV